MSAKIPPQTKPTDAAKPATTQQNDPNKAATAQSPKATSGAQSGQHTELAKNASTSSLPPVSAKGPLIGIDNYDPYKHLEINSPRSLKAMKELGVLPENLKFKTKEELKFKTKDDLKLTTTVTQIQHPPSATQAHEGHKKEEKKDEYGFISKEDLKGFFNLEDAGEKKAYEKLVEMHDKNYKHLVKKISARRKELIQADEKAEAKKKRHDALRKQQLQKLEIEKKTILKKLEEEHKLKEEKERKKREHELKKMGGDGAKSAKDLNKSVASVSSAKGAPQPSVSQKTVPGSQKAGTDLSKGPMITADGKVVGGKDAAKVTAAAGDGKDKKAAVGADGKPHDAAPHTALGPDGKPLPHGAPLGPDGKPLALHPAGDHALAEHHARLQSSTLSAYGKSARSQQHMERHKPLKLDDELKESSILVFLDKSAAQKQRLDLGLQDRTKKDLEKDKKRMKDLMKQEKMFILELSQKRNTSAYKSHEGLGNAKTRKIEYLYDLSRNPVEMMKEKQQKEMEHMMNYEIALQVNTSSNIKDHEEATRRSAQ